MLGTVAAAADANAAVGKKVDTFSLPDITASRFGSTTCRDSRPLVVAFLGTECPLAKQYAPRLAELAKEYEAKGVKFVAIDSNLQDSLAEIAAFAKMHELDFPVLKDMNNRVADAFGATRTPEVFVLDRDRVVRYAGRIDDQYGFKTGAGYAKPKLERARPGRGASTSCWPASRSAKPVGQGRRLLDRPRQARAARRRHVLEPDRAHPAEIAA